MSKKIWHLKYVVGNPAIFSRVTACADNPMSRAEALAGAEVVANNCGWRVWVERDTGERIFESAAEKKHQSSKGNVGKPTREQFVAEVLRRYESGQENAFEAYRSVYGEPNDDESNLEYVRRCSEQDYADSDHGGCIYQNVIDQIHSS